MRNESINRIAEMSDCLVYWKTFWDDPQKWDYGEVITWHTKDTSFFHKISRGDCIWVVISGGHQFPEEWRLFAKIKIDQLEIQETVYGPYAALGDRDQSVMFDLRDQQNFEPILKSLQFQSNKRIQTSGRRIGNSLQAIRPLSGQDKGILLSYINQLNVTINQSEFLTPSRPNVEPMKVSSRAEKYNNQNIEVQLILLRKKVAFIRQYLNGKVESPLSGEQLCDWVDFCCQFELYKEGRDLFALILKESVHTWYYERTKKIARLCGLKASNSIVEG